MDMGQLQEIDDDYEYFHGVQSYFKKEHIIVDILHKDTFSHEHRVNYFNRMFEKFPADLLIFLDPYTGLEVKNPARRHLLFEEVRKIFDRMDHQSVLMIYQHLPRLIREGYIKKRCRELATHHPLPARNHHRQRDSLFYPDKKSAVQDTDLCCTWRLCRQVQYADRMRLRGKTINFFCKNNIHNCEKG